MAEPETQETGQNLLVREARNAEGMNRFWGFPNKGNHQLDGFRGSFHLSFPAYRTDRKTKKMARMGQLSEGRFVPPKPQQPLTLPNQKDILLAWASRLLLSKIWKNSVFLDVLFAKTMENRVFFAGNWGARK